MPLDPVFLDLLGRLNSRDKKNTTESDELALKSFLDRVLIPGPRQRRNVEPFDILATEISSAKSLFRTGMISYVHKMIEFDTLPDVFITVLQTCSVAAPDFFKSSNIDSWFRTEGFGTYAYRHIIKHNINPELLKIILVCANYPSDLLYGFVTEDIYKNNLGHTRLHEAAEAGNARLVEILLEPFHGKVLTLLQKTNEYKLTPVHCGIQSCYVNVLDAMAVSLRRDYLAPLRMKSTAVPSIQDYNDDDDDERDQLQVSANVIDDGGAKADGDVNKDRKEKQKAVDVFDREAVFIDTVLAPMIERFPNLRIVLEHITTELAVDFVLAQSNKLGATITPQHLCLNRNDLLGHGLRPHLFCLPILKRQSHQQALLRAATSGDMHFFLGTDSAPHTQSAKLSACGCAGIYSGYHALAIYAQVFEQENALDKLESFASRHGAQFYGLPINQETITLVKQAWQVPDSLPFADEEVIPLFAGQTLQWQVQ